MLKLANVITQGQPNPRKIVVRNLKRVVERYPPSSLSSTKSPGLLNPLPAVSSEIRRNEKTQEEFFS